MEDRYMIVESNKKSYVIDLNKAIGEIAQTLKELGNFKIIEYRKKVVIDERK